MQFKILIKTLSIVPIAMCIIGNDHHCPWSSKCVGYKNINMFKLFICSLFLHIFYLTFAAIFAAINANQQRLKAK